MKRLLLLSLICVMLLSCNKKEPTVVTYSPTDVTTASAICGGSVTSDDPLSVTDKGICYSVYDNPTIGGVYPDSPSDYNCISAGSGIGDFSFEINGISYSTTYYVRAYAVYDDEIFYGDVESFKTEEIPIIETFEPKSITSNSAVLEGSVTGDNITDKGIVYCHEGIPSIEQYGPQYPGYQLRISDGEGSGSFSFDVDLFVPNTIYYVCAYAVTDDVVYYGDVISFTTESETDNNMNNHEYVDLGLPSGLKWATCNIGADSPEKSGYFYAWGETNPKVDFTEENSVMLGQAMQDFSGDALYDAATANWGAGWRMPTYDEIGELLEYCDLELTQVNGVTGTKIIGKNGNSIFIPSAGYIGGTKIYSGGKFGCLWSSEPDNSWDNHYFALNLDLMNGYYVMNYSSRYLGKNVRAVFE